MLDQKTGRLSWGEGKALWPGMTHADFEGSILYKEELLDEGYKEERKGQSCHLKTQIIDGFPMAIKLTFDAADYLSDITLTQPEFYDWPDWPKEINEDDYLLQIKNHNDRFLATQLQSYLEGERETAFEFEWGHITSSYSYIHNPDAFIHIYIDAWQYDPNFVPSSKTVSEMMNWNIAKDMPKNKP